MAVLRIFADVSVWPRCLITSRWKLCSEGEILFVLSEIVSLAVYAQALDFVKSLLYPPKSPAKPDALYVDPLFLNAVFQFETLFVFLTWFVPAAPQWELLILCRNFQKSKKMSEMTYFSVVWKSFGSYFGIHHCRSDFMLHHHRFRDFLVGLLL